MRSASKNDESQTWVQKHHPHLNDESDEQPRKTSWNLFPWQSWSLSWRFPSKDHKKDQEVSDMEEEAGCSFY